jgi:maltose alpha-D-glucosyltransferase/alpha-amylase
VLAAGGRFVIIDFEGEPAQPLAERQAKQSPLKDVAGMLRSFSYAAYEAWRIARHHDPDLEKSLGARADAWGAAVAAAFLARYRHTMDGAGLRPFDASAFAPLLDALVLDKALYEVDYELASRPDRVIVPLLGIRQILHTPVAV